VRGPGIAPGSTFSEMGTQVDIAPTFLGLAGLPASPTHDGKSIVPFLIKDADALLESTAIHLREHLPASYKSSWRREVFFEGYFCSYNIKCVGAAADGDYPHSDANCADLKNNRDCWKNGKGNGSSPNCYMTEDSTNNFIGLRQVDGNVNTLYAEFQTGDQAVANIDFDKIDSVEFYDLSSDPWQMRNLAPGQVPSGLHERVQRWYRCAGASCDLAWEPSISI